MSPSTEMLRRERVAAVTALAAPRVPPPQWPMFEAYAQAFFHHFDADDLAARSPEDLLGALLSAWQFAAERSPGTDSSRGRGGAPLDAAQGWGTAGAGPGRAR